MLESLVLKTALVLGISTASAVCLIFIKKKLNNRRVPKKWKVVGKVTKLFIYPLKSGKGLPVDRAECTKFGLKEVPKYNKAIQLQDHIFTVYKVDPEDRSTATSRRFPKMVLVKIRAEGMNSVQINAPNMQPLIVVVPEVDKNNSTRVTTTKGDVITVYDCGDEAANWFSKFILNLKSGLRLGYFDAKFNRNVQDSYEKEKNYSIPIPQEEKGILSDKYIVQLINAASIMDLNCKINGPYVSVENFRPTIVVDEKYLKPHEEDDWGWIKIGNVILRNVAECPRCRLTTIDPESGEHRTDNEPINTLRQYRLSKGPQAEPVMGRYLRVYITGTFNVNDTVYLGQ